MRLLCDPESTRVQSQQHTTQHNARLMAIFQDNLANGHQNATVLDFTGARMMEVVVTTGTTRRAKLQSNRHNRRTNTQLFIGPMPFPLPNQQRQSTEGSHWSTVTEITLMKYKSNLSTCQLVCPTNHATNQSPLIKCHLPQVNQRSMHEIKNNNSIT